MDPKTTNKPTNQNNVDTEMGTFDKIEAYIKNAIFGVLFVLLKDHEMSIYTCFIITCIQFIQLLILPFHATINETWNSSDIVDVLQTAFNYLNIVPYMNDTNFNLYATFFYLGVSFLIVGLVLFFYVSYTVNQKSQIFAWPVIILKYICILITTILFLPLIDYFVSVLACVKNEEGVSVHSMFSEIECWTGVHSLAAGFSILGIILLLVMSSIFSMTYFEYRDVASDPTARTNARPNFLVLAYKTVMIIFLTFLTGTDFQILLIIMILIGSAILFWKFYLSSPYHNEIISKQWSTFTAVNLWTAVMLVFAKIMETSLFEGSIIAWLLGIPFVAMIILANRDPRIGLLLMNVNKFQSGQEVQDQIRYLLKLISWQATNRNSAILLDGYIEIHKQSCNKNDCPLKQKVSKNNRFTKNLMSHDETLNEKYAALIQLLYGMFSYGIRKFPNNTSLRIAYAFFLLEKMQSKQQALQELTQAEKNKPPFDEQFVIYRYKKIVEDEIAESQNEGQGLDVVSEGAFQTQLRILQANIEKCALLHMEFWSQLAEENPDLAKLNDNGSKINTAVQTVEENWTKLIKINNSNTKAMRLYGKFLIEVINDKEAGEDLLEKARNLMNAQLNTHKKGAQMGGANGDDAGNDAAPAVWVSGEQDKFGLITGINLTAASLFGYNKTELLNRKMNALMPQLFAKHHDSFLEHYMNTGEGAIVGKNKERLAFGKNKSNYIFPMYYSLRVVQSIIQGIQFMATFRIEKNFKNAAYVLTHPDGTIDSISSSAISLLKVDLKVISQKKGNIQDLFPNIIKDKQAIFTNSNAGRSTAVLNYTYPRDSEYLLDEDPNIQLNCYLNELVFLAGRENAGFQFRFERLVDKSVSTNIKAKISNFQFKFDLMRMVIVGEYADPPTNSDIQSSQQDEILGGMNRSDAGSSDPGKDIFGFSKKKEKKEEEEEVQVEKIDYTKGIRTLRLVDGRAVEINDDNDEDEEEGELSSKDSSQGGSKHQQLSQQEEDPQEEGSLNDFSTTFKSRKALTTVVNDKTPPQSVRGLRLIINLLGLLFLAIALTDYILCKKEFDKINNQIELLDMSNQRLAEMMTALSKIRDLYLVNINLLDDDPTTLQSELQAALDSAKAIKQDLESQVSTLSTAHLNLLNQPVIKLSGIDATEMKGLTQAADEVITRAYDLVTDSVSDISPTNADYYFVTYNLMNNFYQGLKNSSQYYALELTDQVDGKASTFLLLLIGSIVALVIALVILSPILLQVNKSRDEILSLFLDIPDKTVKTLYAKCETFVQNLQIGEEEDMASEIDEDEMDNKAQEADNSEFTARKKKKKFKNSGRGQHSFFIRFLLVTAVLEGYFVYTYVSSNYVLSNVATMVTELNATSVAESFFSFANNAERQLFINDSGLFPVLSTAPEDVTTSNIILLLDLDSLILEEHSVNRDIQSSDYTNTFNQIMMSEPCPLLTSYVDLATCEAFADQTVYQGMTVALARHIENMRTLLSCYSKIRLNPSYVCNAQPTSPVDTGSGNSTHETILNLMRTSQAYEMSKMQEPYIKGSFRTLMTSFKKGIKEAFDDQLTTKLIIFLIYIVCLLFVYGVLWQSLIKKINTDIWRTKSMLNMIPIHVIARIRSIRFYLKKFWNERNLAEV